MMFEKPNWYKLQYTKEYKALKRSFVIKKSNDNYVDWKNLQIEENLTDTIL